MSNKCDVFDMLRLWIFMLFNDNKRKKRYTKNINLWNIFKIFYKEKKLIFTTFYIFYENDVKIFWK